MNRRMIGLATAALLTISGAVFAAPQQKGPAKTGAAQTTSVKATDHKAQPTHTTRGMVSSIDTSQLMLSPGKGRKDIIFIMGAEAQRPANLVAGDKVTVHYRVENNQNIVTSIQAQSPGSAANTAKKKT